MSSEQLTRCSGVACPHRDTCQRFVIKNDEYVMNPPKGIADGEVCKTYVPALRLNCTGTGRKKL